MGEVLESAGRTQIRIAETEKYPHVTFSSLVVEKKNL
jgi:2,3-bisphosphoglycerate-independent phosphoglycerate mutase